jgi:sec-independent protein translocase protein TatC
MPANVFPAAEDKSLFASSFPRRRCKMKGPVSRARSLVDNRFLTVLDGLERARRGIAVYALLVAGLFFLCLFFAEPVLFALARLLGRKLVAYNPAEAVLAMLSVALYLSLVLSFPAGVFLLWRGVALRRRPDWVGWGGAVIAVATGLFLAGVGLGYAVLLPAGISFLVGYETAEAMAFISARKFVSFCGTILLALGVSFEAPLVSFLLARAGWLDTGFFREKWRHALLGSVVLAAFITPTPDVYNLMLMTLPLIALYFVSYGVVWAANRSRGQPPQAG